MALLVKFLSHKLEDLSSDPQNPHKIYCMSVTLALGV